MKDIISDIDENIESYISKMNPILIYIIYGIIVITSVSIAWMYLFKIDIVVKGNGIVRSEEQNYKISSDISGQINKVNIKDGEFIKDGDILFTLCDNEIDKSIDEYECKLLDINERIEMLKLYEEWIDGNEQSLDAIQDNQYYKEFIIRKELFESIVNLKNNEKSQEKSTICEENIKDIRLTISEYENKKIQIEQAKKCIIDRNNSLDAQNIYYNIVDTYICNYFSTEQQYDFKINNIQKNNINNEEINVLTNEKKYALLDIENRQILEIEQIIENINSTIYSLESNLVAARLQLKTIEEENLYEDTVISEKNNLSNELLECENKIKEYKEQIKNYTNQKNDCIIKSNKSGYFYFQQDISEGSYLQGGSEIGIIYPDKINKYYIELYVENADIVKLKIGQKVKISIEGYMSNEFDHFEGEIANIPADKVSNDTYYIVKVKCNIKDSNIQNKKTLNIKNGMLCKASVVINEKSVLEYIIKKIDLWN